MGGTPLHDGIGWSLGVLLRSHRAAVTEVLGDVPQGPRGFQTLAEVVRGDHESQLALAAHLGIDRTVMTYLVDDLVGAGLVERQPHPTDRRQKVVVATSRGATVIADLCERVAEAENQMLGALEPAEREVFRALIEKIACSIANVDRSFDPCTEAEC